MKLLFLIALSFTIKCSRLYAQDTFMDLKSLYEEHKDHKPWIAKDALFKMVELEANEEMFDFLREVYAEPPRLRREPEWADIRSPREMPGYAEVILIMLGETDIKDKLIAEILNDNKGVRYSALSKASMVKGDLGVELLSYFIGDTYEQGGKPLGPLDWGAVIELSKRIEDPPMKLVYNGRFQPYEKGGRTAWLKWRYENFGPIPGREELFMQFAEADVADTGSGETTESLIKSEVSGSIALEIEESTETVTPKPTEEPVEKSPTWRLWLIGLLVLISSIGFLVHQKRKS